MASPHPLPVQRTLARDTPFSYRCEGCGRCCHDKLIQVNPYEVARIAHHLGLTTTETLARFTEDGAWLRREADGACSLLQDGRCGVHGDQPLACRLYPLGRRVGPDGGEELIELEPHPLTEGEYGQRSNVAEYLAEQGVEAYLEAAARYFVVLAALASELGRRVAEAPGALGEFDFGPVGGRYPHHGPLPPWLDIDAMVTATLPEPAAIATLDPWHKMELHLDLLAALARPPSTRKTTP